MIHTSHGESYLVLSGGGGAWGESDDRVHPPRGTALTLRPVQAFLLGVSAEGKLAGAAPPSPRRVACWLGWKLPDLPGHVPASCTPPPPPSSSADSWRPGSPCLPFKPVAE